MYFKSAINTEYEKYHHWSLYINFIYIIHFLCLKTKYLIKIITHIPIFNNYNYNRLPIFLNNLLMKQFKFFFYNMSTKSIILHQESLETLKNYIKDVLNYCILFMKLQLQLQLQFHTIKV